MPHTCDLQDALAPVAIHLVDSASWRRESTHRTTLARAMTEELASRADEGDLRECRRSASRPSLSVSGGYCVCVCIGGNGDADVEAAPPSKNLVLVRCFKADAVVVVLLLIPGENTLEALFGENLKSPWTNGLCEAVESSMLLLPMLLLRG
jgi:hypothetical protein